MTVAVPAMAGRCFMVFLSVGVCFFDTQTVCPDPC